MAEIKETIDKNEISPGLGEMAGRAPERIIDLKENVTVPREVESWLKELEKGEDLNQNNTNAKNDDSVLQPIAKTVTKITLPTNRTSFTGGFSKPINQAWRWLSEFVLRIIKKNQGKVKFKEE
jgi:hypothetical protein